VTSSNVEYRRGVLALVLTLAVAADEGRFQDYALGARAASLGGAYTALSDDADGVFTNPAGIVDVHAASVNVSTSLYGLELIGKSPDPAALLRLSTLSDIILVPSSTGFVSGVGDKLPSGAYRDAFAIATQVPDYTSRFSEDVPKDIDGARDRSDLEDRRFYLGAAWAHRFGPWLRAGASLQYTLRSINDDENFASGALEKGAFIDASTTLRSYNHGLRATGGLKLFIGPRASFGLMIATPTASVYRDVTFEQITTSSSGYKVARSSSSGFEWQSDLPAEARLGFAFTEPASYTISVDVSGHLPASYDAVPALSSNIANVPIPLHVDRGPVANIAAGVEGFVTDDISLACGAFTNFTGAPALTLDKNGDLTADSSRLSTVSMFGGSIAIGFHSKYTVTRIGFTGSTGTGALVEPTAPDARFLELGPPLHAINTQQTLLYFFVGGTVNLGDEGASRDYAL
jgi:long-chain fatty acid transport protein